MKRKLTVIIELEFKNNAVIKGDILEAGKDYFQIREHKTINDSYYFITRTIYFPAIKNIRITSNQP
ncbi:hypothetical protein J4468_01320 [Candidatus Woesearchaeota archaeon]|nr:hypothetical protein [Candidatus Woesearchaeota archaeon]